MAEAFSNNSQEKKRWFKVLFSRVQRTQAGDVFILYCSILSSIRSRILKTNQQCEANFGTSVRNQTIEHQGTAVLLRRIDLQT